jgi:3-deoxy-manno-octulosonate cytidylyltransferase (CMP-KDO synthetase)
LSDFIVIIPARLNSSRLPEKLLQDVASKPLLYLTYINALKSKAKKVIIATDDIKIQNVMQDFGANCILTSKDHNSGTSRIAEVIRRENIPDNQIIINVQGDEPLMPFENINQLADNLTSSKALVATLCENFKTIKDYQNPNNVKVVFAKNHNAMYFSRSPIPHFRDAKINLDICYKHIGIYGYRTEFFQKNLDFQTYENAEKLEQLSILQSGYNIHIDKAKHPSGIGVDTLEDLEQLRKIVNGNN